MIDRSELLAKAAAWMHARGWRAKLAKKRGYEQTLFEHTLVEVDALLTLLPILADPRHYGLTEAERETLVAAVLVHDVGKETDAWQRYVRGAGVYVPHIVPELTREVVALICAALGFARLDESAMALCTEFHHSKPGRSDGSIMEAVLAEGGGGGGQNRGSDRFLTLAHLVKAIDHCCSAATPSDAAAADFGKRMVRGAERCGTPSRAGHGIA